MEKASIYVMDAVQFSESKRDDAEALLRTGNVIWRAPTQSEARTGVRLVLLAPEGATHVRDGDWVIKNLFGHCYSYKVNFVDYDDSL